MSNTKKLIKKSYDEGYIPDDDGNIWFRNNKIELVLGTTKMRYLMYYYKGKTLSVHQLVAYHKYKDQWLYDSKIVVRHLDGNKHNNNYDNIGIGTQQQNLLDIPTQQRRHMGDAGRNSKNWKHHRHIVKFTKCLLSYDDAAKIRQLYADGIPQKELARRYAVAVNTIHAIVKDKIYVTSMSADDLLDDNIKPFINQTPFYLKRKQECIKTEETIKLDYDKILSNNKLGIIKATQHNYKVIHGTLMLNGDIIKCGVDGDGYYYISRWLDGKKYRIHVHKLVAYDKFGDRYLYTDLLVRHLDGCKTNNNHDNIELGTNQQNQLDISLERRMELSKKMRNRKRSKTEEENYRKAVAEKICKYKRDDVLYIRQLYSEGMCYADISRSTGIRADIIRNIIIGKTYKHVV